MKLSNLSTSYYQHSIVALITGLWLSFFLILIAPFDASDLSLRFRIILLPVYGAIAALTYLSLIPIQNLIQKQRKKWDVLYETTFIFIFVLISLAVSYLYYQSGIINGSYNLPEFILGQYFPIFLILLPIIIFSRWFLFRKPDHSVSELIILEGDNKLDILKIELSNLICINSANNYIEVNYLEDRELKSKLLRTTLKKIHSKVPCLIKVHRSYLVNPVHFMIWIDSKTLRLTKMEVPVSKKYKNDVLSLNHSSLK